MSSVPSVDEVAHPRSGGGRDDSFVVGLRCRACGHEHPQVASHLCELCFGPLEVAYDYRAVREVISRKRIEAGPPTLWRYSDLLPVRGGDVVSLGEGFTPLIHARNLGRELGLHNLHLKDDTQNPTNSFKDRVVSVAINWALRNGFTPSRVLRPAISPTPSPPTPRVQGCEPWCSSPPTSSRRRSPPPQSSGRRSSRSRATTTTSTGSVPSSPTISTGASATSTCAPTTAREARPSPSRPPNSSAGDSPMRSSSRSRRVVSSSSTARRRPSSRSRLVAERRVPRFTGAQALGCSPVARPLRGAPTRRAGRPDTIARSIAIGNPSDGGDVVRIARRRGRGGGVTEEEILEGIELLAATEGIFTETAGGVTVAVLRKLARQGRWEGRRDDRRVHHRPRAQDPGRRQRPPSGRPNR